jgi:hypothetical protein
MTSIYTKGLGARRVNGGYVKRRRQALACQRIHGGAVASPRQPRGRTIGRTNLTEPALQSVILTKKLSVLLILTKLRISLWLSKIFYGRTKLQDLCNLISHLHFFFPGKGAPRSHRQHCWPQRRRWRKQRNLALEIGGRAGVRESAVTHRS